MENQSSLLHRNPLPPLVRLLSSPLLFFSHRTYFFLILNFPSPGGGGGLKVSSHASGT